MDVLATVELVRAEGNLPESLAAEKLQPHLDSASIRMRRLLSASKYNRCLKWKKGDEEATPDQLIILNDITKAEAILTVGVALPVLNIDTMGEGIVSSKGFDQSKSQLLSQTELAALAKVFEDKAMMILEPHLPQRASQRNNGEGGYVNAGGLSMGSV